MLRLRLQFLCAAVAMVAAAHAGTTVQATTPEALQSAIDACDSGCRIELSAPLYTLTKPIRIEGKRDLQIVGMGDVRPVLRWDASLLVNVANPVSGQVTSVPKLFTLSWQDISGNADPTRPAGWLMWPSKGSISVVPTNGPMGSSTDTSSKYSTSGFQHNGMIFVQGSRNVTLESLEMDGVKSAYFINSCVWSGQYDVLFGSVGVNLFQTLRTRVVNCDLHNFWSAFYLNDRNLACHAKVNANDLDAAKLSPYTACGEMGAHIIEQSRIHGNWWVAYSESEWDMGSVFHDNLAWNNRQDTTYPYGGKGSSEINNQTGGFLFLKDVIYPAHVLSGNTLVNTRYPIGWGYYRGSISTLFSDNLIGPIPSAVMQDAHQILTHAASWRTLRNAFALDSATHAFRIQEGTQFYLDGEDAKADTAWFATSDFAIFRWSPVLGDSVHGRSVSWFSERALDSAARLCLPKSASSVAYDTTDNRYCIGCGFLSLDSSSTSFLAPTWGSRNIDSAVFKKGFVGRSVGAVQPAGGVDTKGILWSCGTPGVDSVRQTLHLPVQLLSVPDGAMLLVKDAALVARSCASMMDEYCSDTKRALSLDNISYRADSGELVVKLPQSDTLLQIDVWAAAVVNGDTLPLAPATWTWAKGMKYSRAAIPASASIAKLPSALHLHAVHGRAGCWSIDVSGIQEGTVLRLMDASGRSMAFAQTRTGATSRRLDVSGVHAGTWFLKASALPAQRVFLAP